MSRRLKKRPFDINLKNKKKQIKKESERREKGEKDHTVFSLLTEEIVELSYEQRCKVLTI